MLVAPPTPPRTTQRGGPLRQVAVASLGPAGWGKPGSVPTAQGLIRQWEHALGSASQWAKTRLGLVAVGYFESTKNDFLGGRGV